MRVTFHTLAALFAGVFFVISCLWAFAPATAINRYASTVPVLAQASAVPVLTGLIVFVMGMLWLWRVGSQGWWRLGPFLLMACAVPLMLGGFNVIGGAEPQSIGGTRDGNEMGKELTIVSFNVGDGFNADAARAIFVDADADIVILPQQGELDFAYSRTRDSIVKEAGADPDRWQWFTYPKDSDFYPITIAVKKTVGRYRDQSDTAPQVSFGTVRLEPVDDNSLPVIIGVHTAPPMPWLMGKWVSDTKLVVEELGRVPAIIGGDFNATLRHGWMPHMTDRVKDVGTTGGVGLYGTWPAFLPAFLRAQIDHIFIPAWWVVEDVDVRVIGPSDHAAVFTRVRGE